MRPLCGELNTAGASHCGGARISNGAGPLSEKLVM